MLELSIGLTPTASVPGNPGLLSFYVPFLTTLAQSPLFPPNCAILAIGHVSHAPHLDQPEGGPVGLEGLVQTQLAVVDELREILGQGGKLNVGGHSMGCWVAVEVSTVVFLCSWSM